MLLDRGEMGPATLRDLLAVVGDHADYAKLAWASSLVMGKGTLEQKLQVYRDANVTPLFGGTLFEYAYMHGKVQEVLDFTRDHSIRSGMNSRTFFLFPMKLSSTINTRPRQPVAFSASSSVSI